MTEIFANDAHGHILFDRCENSDSTLNDQDVGDEVSSGYSPIEGKCFCLFSVPSLAYCFKPFPQQLGYVEVSE